MFDRLEDIVARYEELGVSIAQAEVIADQERWRGMMREHAELEALVEAYREYKATQSALADTEAMMNDADMAELAREEHTLLVAKREELTAKLRVLLLPRDPNDEKSVVVEFRPAAGGEESALFSANLLRMYTLYAEKRGWKVELMSITETELGGLKEATLSITARGAYSRMKFESGVHRVQRVPDTESQGRIHTSTVTVAVLPEAEDVDVEINPNDLRIDTYRAGGAGGQHVNRTDSAVRITHMPSGIVVQCQNERSQLQNRETAMRMLRAKLLDDAVRSRASLIADERRSQIGTGDRSERIRTYNFPQNRVTDHRINLTLYQLDSFINGDLDPVVDALILADQTEKLQAQGS